MLRTAGRRLDGLWQVDTIDRGQPGGKRLRASVLKHLDAYHHAKAELDNLSGATPELQRAGRDSRSWVRELREINEGTDYRNQPIDRDLLWHIAENISAKSEQTATNRKAGEKQLAKALLGASRT